MKSNLAIDSIEKAFQSALSKGLIREEDTAIIFYDLSFLEERIRHLVSLFPGPTLHGIAIKANPLIRVLEFMRDLGVGIEAATMGEVQLALNAGYKPDIIVYDSPVKTLAELEFALKAGIHINVDNLHELQRVVSLKKSIHSESTVGIRINPQVGVGTILESSVAGEYSKFGVPVKYKRKELMEAFLENEWLTGVHLHVGSQGCPMDLLIDGIGVLYDFANEVNRQTGRRQIDVFDLGGGLPISYNRSIEPVSMEAYCRSIKSHFPGLFDGSYRLITEFGRWVYANTGWTISRVEYAKRDPDINTAMIHVGADLFLRECLNPIDWPHEYSVMDRFGKVKDGRDENPYNLAGPLCFSGDILARNVVLPVVEESDYLVIHDTGGYTFSMWSRYNSRQTPRIIGYFNDGEQFIILKERETFDELFRFWI